MDFIFNHDGFAILEDVADTAMTDQDVYRILVDPLLDNGITVIDWTILSTGIHNCRTRHNRGITRARMERSHERHPRIWGKFAERRFTIGDVVEHFNARDRDLLDLIVDRCHERGAKAFGGMRLNHSLDDWMIGIPGTPHTQNQRRDFRCDDFQAYLLEVYEDLLAKGVDGITLDFERKAPFFTDDVPQQQRFEACTRFARKIRALTDKTVAARVAYEKDKGAPQGQDPKTWIREGLVDIIIPATHNHEPDPLNWTFERFLDAAHSSQYTCQVIPQVWPTPEPWGRELDHTRHSPEAVEKRVRSIVEMGGNGAYFFNFCCYGVDGYRGETYRHMFHPDLP